MNGLKKIWSALMVVVMCLPLIAQAGDSWAHKKKLSFDTTASGVELGGEAAQVPLLIRLHSGNFGFADAKADGADLRFFAADDKTALKFHIEQFDQANELAIVWVQMPKLLANSKTDAIWMHWGNADAPPASDMKGTYDAVQILDFHFDGKEGKDNVKDATGNANNASGSNATIVTDGPIGSAASFDGNAKILVPASKSLKLTAAGGFTFSAWVKPAALDSSSIYVQRDGARSLTIGTVNGVLTATLDKEKAAASAPLKPAVWQHIAVVENAGKISFFIDGKEAGSGPFALADIAGELALGEGYRGQMDEVSLAGVGRSIGYIKALAGSQLADSPLMAIPDTEEASEGGVNYVSILLGAVTIDGWVVIGILMIMCVVSFWVMITKTISISKINKANEEFLDVFSKKSNALLTPGSNDIRVLDANPGVRHSTIYHLYAIGLREMKHRFDAQIAAGQTNALTHAALDAIRASLDASMVRENQRLNSGMVLLTIAISGGPFLGLLGTVVGVMITFAAIAAAGDVNVNAIAPGIAAALVATVAGLAVAIPALFGYNWLAIKIKNASADTQVFADEFVTKSAEMYSA
ncbi:biopolymer transport protein ExbB [Oxalobacteraceae bacterium GrIS 1.18]